LEQTLNSMHPIWKQESGLARALETDRALGSANSPVMAESQFHEEDLASLDQIIPALQSVQKRLGHNQEHYIRIGELIELVRHFRGILPTQSPEQAFECIQPLRRWLFWLPPAMLRGGSGDMDALAVIAQFYGVGVALDGIFPNMGGAYLGPLCVRPIEEISQLIMARNTADPFDTGLEFSLSLLQLPRHIAHNYRNRRHWSPRPSVDQYSSSSPSPYSAQDYRVSSSSPSSTATYAPYTPPLQSPPAVKIANSPVEVAASATQAMYPPSPRLLSHSRELPAFSQSGPIHHSSGYAPAYVDDMMCGMQRVGGSIGVNSGMYSESHPVHAGGLVATEPCWT
jgi:hypothetical protein